MDNSLIKRQDAIEICMEQIESPINTYFEKGVAEIIKEKITELPSAEPERLPDVYMKAVWTWLIDYQIKSAELQGRYTPYEVLSWVVNDWRKEHE